MNTVRIVRAVIIGLCYLVNVTNALVSESHGGTYKIRTYLPQKYQTTSFACGHKQHWQLTLREKTVQIDLSKKQRFIQEIALMHATAQSQGQSATKMFNKLDQSFLKSRVITEISQYFQELCFKNKNLISTVSLKKNLGHRI